ncbi:MAG TPA: branched-chain amino acid transaminase [Immundisolibacter sp.]|jgi:branched-chain amino acid aminotransferase
MGMEDRDGVIWVDGELVPWREAKVHVLTHSLHYGMGVFEGIRAYKTPRGTALFRMPEHVDRMFTSAHILQMHIPFSREQIADACMAAIRENHLEGGYVRPLAFYGSEAMGVSAPNLTVHVIVAAWKWGEYLGEGALERGVRLRTSSYARHHINVTMCRTKATGNYINSMLALREAQACGYDEALLLDVDGYVAEGSGENVFVIRKGVIYTPDITSALEGITRDTVITLAREAGYEVREKRITRDEVYIADEAFFTGTAAEVTPIRSLDDRLIGEGRPGPITKLLQDRYFATVNGELDGHLDWLTTVK